MDEPQRGIEVLAKEQPFCAGVCVFGTRGLFFTLAKMRRWERGADGTVTIPICWVGGGQEIGEGVAACACREGQEELGVRLHLQSAELTYTADLVNELRWSVSAQPGLAPILIERRPGLREPYKPGLPVGPFVYVVVYGATTAEMPVPGDVPGIVEISRQDIMDYEQGICVAELRRRGRALQTKPEVPDSAVLRYQTQGPEMQLLKLFVEGKLDWLRQIDRTATI